MNLERFSQIEGVLHADLEQARERHAQANRNFQDIARYVPTLLPAPDGLANLENSALFRKTAFGDYKRALDRFNDFVIRGVVPTDLSG